MGISKVMSHIWRWDGVDADHGFPIVGYLSDIAGSLILIDPPGTSGTKELIESAGKPQAIMLTSQWHVRGAPHWAEVLGLSIYAPASAKGELDEAGGKLDQVVEDGDDVFGWKAIELSTPPTDSYAYHELAFWHADSKSLVIGDLITEGEDGTLNLGPHVFGGVPLNELRPWVQRLADLQPETLLSAHIGVKEKATELLLDLAESL